MCCYRTQERLGCSGAQKRHRSCNVQVTRWPLKWQMVALSRWPCSLLFFSFVLGLSQQRTRIARFPIRAVLPLRRRPLRGSQLSVGTFFFYRKLQNIVQFSCLNQHFDTLRPQKTKIWSFFNTLGRKTLKCGHFWT